MTESPVVLVTGAAQRVGAAIAAKFHHSNYRVIIHCRHSIATATEQVARLNAIRPNSAAVLQADLTSAAAVQQLAEEALAQFGRLDVLVNNASAFYATPFGSMQQSQWDELIDSNVRAALFLAQELATELSSRHGAIVNLVDIYADKPLAQHSIYNIAKAGLKAMTKSLALELAPAVRVNGVSPGAILWPEVLSDETDSSTQASRDRILQQIPLGQLGTAQQIADTVYFLAAEASYITGEVLRVDGGRSLNL